jgi:cell division protein FtsB
VVTAEIEEEKEKQLNFETRREYYTSDAYVEQVAREQLGMVKPNEIIYINRSE